MENYYIIRATWSADYQILCEFADGKSGNLNLAKYKDFGGVFIAFRDPEIVKNFSLSEGVLTWQNGSIDIATETAYANATGSPLPPWLEAD